MSQRTIFRKGLVFMAIMAFVVPVCGTAEAAIAIYRLNPESTYQQGCVPPCMCPVSLAEKMKGTFTLDELKPTPLFTRYNVANVSWVVVDSSGKVVHTIKGHGIYQVGGEVALLQQLILDLRIDGANLEVFDSGLVPVESPFPSISISVDHDAKCFEIRLDIKADPK